MMGPPGQLQAQARRRLIRRPTTPRSLGGRRSSAPARCEARGAGLPDAPAARRARWLRTIRRAAVALRYGDGWTILTRSPRSSATSTGRSTSGATRIKDSVGNVQPAYYKRGLKNAIESGGRVPDYVRRYLYKPPSNAYKKLEAADSLDLACEAVVADAEAVRPPLQRRRCEGARAAGSALKAIAARKADPRTRIDERHASLPGDADEHPAAARSDRRTRSRSTARPRAGPRRPRRDEPPGARVRGARADRRGGRGVPYGRRPRPRQRDRQAQAARPRAPRPARGCAYRAHRQANTLGRGAAAEGRHALGPPPPARAARGRAARPCPRLAPFALPARAPQGGPRTARRGARAGPEERLRSSVSGARKRPVRLLQVGIARRQQADAVRAAARRARPAAPSSQAVRPPTCTSASCARSSHSRRAWTPRPRPSRRSPRPGPACRRGAAADCRGGVRPGLPWYRRGSPAGHPRPPSHSATAWARRGASGRTAHGFRRTRRRGPWRAVRSGRPPAGLGVAVAPRRAPVGGTRVGGEALDLPTELRPSSSSSRAISARQEREVAGREPWIAQGRAPASGVARSSPRRPRGRARARHRG